MNKATYQGITGRNSWFISDVFFVVGLVAAIAIRIGIFFQDSAFTKLLWYLAMTLYTFFFVFRLYIDRKRKELISKGNLRDKILANKCDKKDREKIHILLDSILVSKFSWNILIILIITVVFLIVQIVIDINSII